MITIDEAYDTLSHILPEDEWPDDIITVRDIPVRDALAFAGVVAQQLDHDAELFFDVVEAAIVMYQEQGVFFVIVVDNDGETRMGTLFETRIMSYWYEAVTIPD